MCKIKQIIKKTAAICSIKEYCKKDILDKIRKYGLDEKETGKIITFLVNNRFIDERRYAHAYVKDKFAFNNWGKTKISMMLASKGIDEHEIHEALSVIPEDEYLSACIKILLSIIRQKNLDFRLPEDRNKIIRHLLNKGYEYDIIRQAIREIEK